jgi:hypothetical protein
MVLFFSGLLLKRSSCLYATKERLRMIEQSMFQVRKNNLCGPLQILSVLHMATLALLVWIWSCVSHLLQKSFVDAISQPSLLTKDQCNFIVFLEYLFRERLSYMSLILIAAP